TTRGARDDRDLSLEIEHSLTPQFDGAALARQRARDDQPLDLGRALPDLVDLRVPEPFLDGVLLYVSVPAEDLDRIGGDLHRRDAREAFRHRAFGALEGDALC